jgi:hypothetical protein
MSGIQPHGCTFPCYLCKAHRKDFLTTCYPERTVRSLFEDHAAFKLWCVGKSKTAIEKGAKEFYSVAYPPVIAKPTTEEELDQPTRHVLAIDELHLVTGIFKTIYYACKVFFPTMDRWPKKCGCQSQGYHGGVFTGGDSTLMLEQVGLLDNMAQGELNLTVLRFVAAFRALDKVRKACFATYLRADWSEALDEFKSAMTDLITDKEMGVNCTTKIHVVFWHVRQECEDQVKLNPKNPRGLGRVSSQTGESMHKAFLRYLLKYSPHWNNVDLLNDELFRATTSWASKCLWAKLDPDGDTDY